MRWKYAVAIMVWVFALEAGCARVGSAQERDGDAEGAADNAELQKRVEKLEMEVAELKEMLQADLGSVKPAQTSAVNGAVLKTANYPVADAANVEAEASARKERDAGRARMRFRASRGYRRGSRARQT
jgi:hypothetical protein